MRRFGTMSEQLHNAPKDVTLRRVEAGNMVTTPGYNLDEGETEPTEEGSGDARGTE